MLDCSYKAQSLADLSSRLCMSTNIQDVGVINIPGLCSVSIAWYILPLTISAGFSITLDCVPIQMHHSHLQSK